MRPHSTKGPGAADCRGRKWNLAVQRLGLLPPGRPLHRQGDNSPLQKSRGGRDDTGRFNGDTQAAPGLEQLGMRVRLLGALIQADLPALPHVCSLCVTHYRTPFANLTKRQSDWIPSEVSPSSDSGDGQKSMKSNSAWRQPCYKRTGHVGSAQCEDKDRGPESARPRPGANAPELRLLTRAAGQEQP